jgi:hypothetical protein
VHFARVHSYPDLRGCRPRIRLQMKLLHGPFDAPPLPSDALRLAVFC